MALTGLLLNWRNITCSQAAALSVLATVVALVFYIIYNLFFSPLAHIKGPFWARAGNFWNFYYFLRGTRFLKVYEAHNIYGPVVRVAPNAVEIADYEYLPSVYGAKLDKIYAWSLMTYNDNVQTAFSAIQSREAQGKRRGMLPHYATANLVLWQPVFEERVSELMTALRTLGSSGSVDVMKMTAHLLLDVFGELVLDTKLGALSQAVSGRTVPLMSSIQVWAARGAWIRELGSLWPLAAQIPTSGWQDMFKSSERVGAFVSPYVLEARKKIKEGMTPERPSLAHRLSTAVNSSIGSLWPAEQVISECCDHMLAGTDPSAITMAYCLWELSVNPDKQAKLQTELDAQMEDPGRYLSVQELARLPYLNAVLKETFRLHPAFPAGLPRVVPKGGGGIYVHDVYIPEGTVIQIQPHSTHRDKRVFGDDVEVFRPERWLQDTPEMNQALIPFSLGSRSCPGKNIVWANLRLLLATINRSFTVTPGRTTTLESMAPRDCGGMMPTSGKCELYFTTRL